MSASSERDDARQTNATPPLKMPSNKGSVTKQRSRKLPVIGATIFGCFIDPDKAVGGVLTDQLRERDAAGQHTASKHLCQCLARDFLDLKKKKQE